MGIITNLKFLYLVCSLHDIYIVFHVLYSSPKRKSRLSNYDQLYHIAIPAKHS